MAGGHLVQLQVDGTRSKLRQAATAQHLAMVLNEYRSNSARMRDLEHRVRMIKQERRRKLLEDCGFQNHVKMNIARVDDGFYRPDQLAARL